MSCALRASIARFGSKSSEKGRGHPSFNVLSRERLCFLFFSFAPANYFNLGCFFQNQFLFFYHFG